ETHGYRDGVTPVELGKRAYGRFKALMGAEYVEGIKVKVNEKLDALAAQGRPGGGHAFGYRRTTNEKGERASRSYLNSPSMSGGPRPKPLPAGPRPLSPVNSTPVTSRLCMVANGRATTCAACSPRRPLPV